MTQKQYGIFILPHSGQNLLKFYLPLYRDLRLESLTTGEIAGSYETETKLLLSHFENWLTDPRRITLIAVYYTEADQRCALEKGEWVGVYHLIGPIPLSEWTWPNIGNLRPDTEETRWHIFGAYVKPAHRKVQPSLTKLLVQAVKRHITAETIRILGPQTLEKGRSIVWMRLRTAVVVSNQNLVLHHRKLGGQLAGYVTYDAAGAASENGYAIEPPAADKDSESDGHKEKFCVVLEDLMEINALSGPTSPRRNIAKL
jgi:hypothetical protein